MRLQNRGKRPGAHRAIIIRIIARRFIEENIMSFARAEFFAANADIENAPPCCAWDRLPGAKNTNAVPMKKQSIVATLIFEIFLPCMTHIKSNAAERGSEKDS